MKLGTGSQELTRLAAAYVTSIAFGVTFLVASIGGVGGSTALLRSTAAAGSAFVFGMLLAPAVVDVVLSAMARDQAKRHVPKENDA